jgi:iron complex outermembrane receptor protein
VNPSTGARVGDLSPFSPAYLTVSSGFPTGGMGGFRSTRGATLLAHVPLASRLSLGGTLAWSRFRTRFAGDFDGTALGIISTGEDSRNRQRSGEARLTWTPLDSLRLVLGGNIAHERASQYVPIVINEREVLALQTGVIRRTNPVLAAEATYNSAALVARQLAGVLGAAGVTLPASQLAALAGNVSTGHRENLTRTSDAHYYDIFWNGTLDVSPALQVEGGARWSRVERTSGLISIIRDRSVLAGVIGALQQPAPARAAILGALSTPGAGTVPRSAGYPIPVFGLLSQGTAAAAGETAPLSDDGVTGRLAVRYAASRSLNMFVNYARGRRPALLSAQAPLTPNGPARFTPLAAETLDSVELGAKLRTADRRLEFDATSYIYGYRHFQTQLVRGTTLVSLDAGEARSHGVEATARYRPVTALTLFGTYAWSHARFAAGLYDGNHVRLSPDHAASAGLTAEAHGGGARFALTPTVDWRSRLFFDDTNGNLAQRADAFLPPLPYQASQAGYARANLRLGVSPDRGPWSLELFVANLTNTRYVRDLGQGSLSFGLPSYVAAPPRTFGATYTLRNMPGA